MGNINWDAFRNNDHSIDLIKVFDILTKDVVIAPAPLVYAKEYLNLTMAFQPVRSRQCAALALMHAAYFAGCTFKQLEGKNVTFGSDKETPDSIK